MSADEAQRLNVDEKDRWQYIRVDSAKLNLAPNRKTRSGLHLLGIDLENGADGREADNVQTVERRGTEDRLGRHNIPEPERGTRPGSHKVRNRACCTAPPDEAAADDGPEMS